MNIKKHFVPGILLIFFASHSVWGQTENYHDLTLENAIEIALVKNRDIQNAEEETDKAKYQIIEAASGALPQVHGFWDSQKTLKP